MRIFPAFLTLAFLASLAACSSPSASSDAPVTDGTCIISAHTVNNDQPTRARLGGKTFTISKNTITWIPAGSLPLAAGWGLLELVDSPAAVTINLDGVKLADVPK